MHPSGPKSGPRHGKHGSASIGKRLPGGRKGHRK